jgi:acyl-CoA thioesterase
MTDLDLLTTPAAAGPGAFTLEVPDHWQQGRGAYGGLVLAALTRAAEAAVADPARTLRSLSGEIIGPTQPGRADLLVEILRAGSGVTTVATRLVQDGVQAHAMVVLGKPRGDYDAAPTLPPPSPPPWRDVPVIPMGPPHGPAFIQHMEVRPIGPVIFAGAPEAVAEGWVRPRHPGRRRDGAYVVALMDTWWPAILTTFRAPRPMATLTFAFQMVGDLDGLDPEAPLFYRGTGIVGRAGYAVEFRELWGEDGRLVALNQQTFVIMK